MADRVLAPIIVGITGKRDLRGHEDAVRVAMRRLLKLLGERYQATPKILMSALAEGADTIAAEEALKLDDWHVIAPLPLSPELYLEDFGEAAAARFRELLDHPRVKAMTLRPLLDAAVGGRPLPPDALRRKPGLPNPDRTAHYEQVGIFIADRSNLLLAVKPTDEQPGRIGGTARIVNHRLNVGLDDTARDVLSRSQELCPPNLLDNALGGPVWLLDPERLDERSAFPATVLLPPDRTVSWPRTLPHHIDTSLALLDRLNRFNRSVLQISEPQWREDVADRAGPDTGDATSMMKYLRLAMSAVQARKKKWLVSSVLSLALLFSAAVAVIELREGFAGLLMLWWILYTLFGALAIGIYWVASSGFWQQITEDYRAVAEALRVQVVWWESGFLGPDYRVERFYLCGSSGALAVVRSAVRHCINAALLLRTPPTISAGADQKWIDSQIRFFDTRITSRRAYLAMVEASSWLLFLGAMACAAFITLTIVAVGISPADNPGRYDIRPLIYQDLQHIWAFTHLPSGSIFLGCLILLSFAGWGAIRLQKLGVLRWLNLHLPGGRIACIAIVVFVGIIFAATLYDLAEMLLRLGLLENVANYLLATVPRETQDATPAAIPLGDALATVFAVVPAALSGAIRFIAEKLSWEAELHGYEDTQRTFKYAKAELAAIDAAAVRLEMKAQRRRDVLIALGKEALEENEGWIRAHRERLIEPV
jgi:hypothetical protein